MRLYTILAGAALFALPLAANAAQVVCPEPGFVNEPNAKVEDPSGLISATFRCEYTVPANNSIVASIASINGAAFFGSTAWEANDPNQTQDQNGGLSGNWEIKNADFSNYIYGIFFKDGNGTNLIGFIFNTLYDSGVWSTPFTSPPFMLSGNATMKQVSHYTIARVDPDLCIGCAPTPTDVDVPEPMTLSLLGAGLVGLAAARRRRRS